LIPIASVDFLKAVVQLETAVALVTAAAPTSGTAPAAAIFVVVLAFIAAALFFAFLFTATFAAALFLALLAAAFLFAFLFAAAFTAALVTAIFRSYYFHGNFVTTLAFTARIAASTQKHAILLLILSFNKRFCLSAFLLYVKRGQSVKIFF